MGKILVLAANPIDTDFLRLDREVREIGEGLRLSRLRDSFTMIPVLASRARDVRRAILEHEPQIIHFCGHGAPESGIFLEDEIGVAQPMPVEGLAKFLGLFARTVDCVVLNACWSEAQAEAIATYLDVVVGMDGPVEDNLCIEFAVAFYDALGAGESYWQAFSVAEHSVRLLEAQPLEVAPRLHLRPGSVERKATTATLSGYRAEGAKQGEARVRRLILMVILVVTFSLILFLEVVGHSDLSRLASWSARDTLRGPPVEVSESEEGVEQLPQDSLPSGDRSPSTEETTVAGRILVGAVDEELDWNERSSRIMLSHLRQLRPDLESNLLPESLHPRIGDLLVGMGDRRSSNENRSPGGAEVIILLEQSVKPLPSTGATQSVAVGCEVTVVAARQSSPAFHDVSQHTGRAATDTGALRQALERCLVGIEDRL